MSPSGPLGLSGPIILSDPRSRQIQWFLHNFEHNEPVGLMSQESARSHEPVGSNASIGFVKPFGSNEPVGSTSKEPVGSDEPFWHNGPVGFNCSVRFDYSVGSDEPVWSKKPVALIIPLDPLRATELFGSKEPIPFGFKDPVGSNEPVESNEPIESEGPVGTLAPMIPSYPKGASYVQVGSSESVGSSELVELGLMSSCIFQLHWWVQWADYVK